MTLVDAHASATIRYYAAHDAWEDSVARGDPPLLVALRRVARRQARADVWESWMRLAVHNATIRPCPSLVD